MLGRKVGRSRGLVIALGALALVALPGAGANATTLTSFEATVTAVTDPDLLLSGVSVGSTIYGTFGVDESATDRDASPTVGDYGDAVVSLLLTLGTDTFSVTASPSAANVVYVEDDTGGVDTYVAQLNSDSPAGPTPTTNALLYLLSSNLSLVSGDALPASIPGSSGADWDVQALVQISGTTGPSSYQIDANLTTFGVVPEPSTAAFCLLGLIALASRSRSKRTRG